MRIFKTWSANECEQWQAIRELPKLKFLIRYGLVAYFLWFLFMFNLGFFFMFEPNPAEKGFWSFIVFELQVFLTALLSGYFMICERWNQTEKSFKAHCEKSANAS